MTTTATAAATTTLNPFAAFMTSYDVRGQMFSLCQKAELPAQILTVYAGSTHKGVN